MTVNIVMFTIDKHLNDSLKSYLVLKGEVLKIDHDLISFLQVMSRRMGRCFKWYLNKRFEKQTTIMTSSLKAMSEQQILAISISDLVHMNI